jgi:S-adenosylmethionine hydrolase
MTGERESVKTNGTVVFQSDFGLVDGAVSAMFGVANAVSPQLHLYNLTHEIPQFDIWQASYRLIQTVEYWAPGTVFVSVVDPGVGTDRKSVAVLTESGHYIVTPDNGTLTHVAKAIGIARRHEIEEAENRLKDSQHSYTFHGRDVYAYTGARLAAGLIDLDGVGRALPPQDTFVYPSTPARLENGVIEASVDILDIRYGSLWTNCPRELFAELGVGRGGYVSVTITHHGRTVYGNDLKFGQSFSDVNIGASIVYINSLLNVGVAINQGNFARAHDVGAGTEWRISFCKTADREIS